MAGTGNQSRTLSLDFLRGVAILLVLGRHLPPCQDPSFGIIKDFFNAWFRGGWIGVDLFFVLSGFLVSGLIFREYQAHGSFRPLRFLGRRGFKIYPAFYAAIFTVFIVFKSCGAVLEWNYVLGELLFLQNYLGNILGVTWSLAVEEHFYIFLAIGLFLLSRRKSQGAFGPIPISFLIVALVALVLRLTNSPNLNLGWNLAYLAPTHLRLDGLFFGVLLSYFYHFEHERLKAWYFKWRILIGLLALCCIIPAFCFELERTPFIYTYGFSLLYIGFGMLLLIGLFQFPDDHSIYNNPVLKLPSSAIRLMGFHSYSIYLWHLPAFLWTPAFLANNFGITLTFFQNVLLVMLIAISWGILIAKVIERPFLRLRERLLPSPSRQSIAGPVPPIESTETKPAVL